MSTVAPPQGVEEQDQEGALVADLLQHPAWPLLCKQAIRLTTKGNDALRAMLAATTVDQVALLAINVAATKDTIRTFIYGVYQRADVDMPTDLKNALN